MGTKRYFLIFYTVFCIRNTITGPEGQKHELSGEFESKTISGDMTYITELYPDQNSNKLFQTTIGFALAPGLNRKTLMQTIVKQLKNKHEGLDKFDKFQCNFSNIIEFSENDYNTWTENTSVGISGNNVTYV